MVDLTAPRQYGLKHIPDAALSIIIPHLKAIYPGSPHTDVVNPADSAQLSFEAGKQRVIRDLENELKSRTKGTPHG